MQVTVYGQGSLFIMTILLGAVLAFGYDLIRILRRNIPHKMVLIHLQDFVYWLLVALIMFYVMLHKSYGEIRGFSIIGAFIGMVLYFFTVSEFVIKISTGVIQIIKKVLLLLFQIIATPILLVLKIFTPFGRWWLGFLKKRSRKLRQKAGHKKRAAKRKMGKTLRDIKIIFKKV